MGNYVSQANAFSGKISSVISPLNGLISEADSLEFPNAADDAVARNLSERVPSIATVAGAIISKLQGIAAAILKEAERLDAEELERLKNQKKDEDMKRQRKNQKGRQDLEM